LSPDPVAQLGLAKTDVHAGAVTASGSGVKLKNSDGVEGFLETNL
tara:strand:+ start:666 stop:800 length:135 start_codon:yes stop_codon:yes gene_type:complete